jgi:hypothetical protein
VEERWKSTGFWCFTLLSLLLRLLSGLCPCSVARENVSCGSSTIFSNDLFLVCRAQLNAVKQIIVEPKGAGKLFDDVSVFALARTLALASHKLRHFSLQAMHRYSVANDQNHALVTFLPRLLLHKSCCATPSLSSYAEHIQNSEKAKKRSANNSSKKKVKVAPLPV